MSELLLELINSRITDSILETMLLLLEVATLQETTSVVQNFPCESEFQHLPINASVLWVVWAVSQTYENFIKGTSVSRLWQFLKERTSLQTRIKAMMSHGTKAWMGFLKRIHRACLYPRLVLLKLPTT